MSLGDAKSEPVPEVIMVSRRLCYPILAGVLLASLFHTAPSDARTIRVQADGQGQAPTIADAIFAAAEGDTVLLADGFYRGPENRGLRFDGKAVTLRSESGDPSACVLDAGGEDRVFYVRDGEGPGTVIEGIGIVDGAVSGSARGGGVACIDSSPVFRNCVITGCRAGEFGGGGGFYAHGGSPTLEGCTVAGNRAVSGGGVRTEYAILRVERSIVWGNCSSAPGNEIDKTGGQLILSCSLVPVDGIWGSWIDEGGNIDDDPLFCHPFPCEDASTPLGNYGLAPGSPCLPSESPCGVLVGALGPGCGAAEPGACCLPSGSCIESTATECAADAGVYWGDGTDCLPSPCDEPGACCTPSGDCIVASYEDCAESEGYWLGEGTACSVDACAPLPESCLYVDFDTDDDPWTIESVGRGDAGEFRWVFQCPPVPPHGEAFSIDIHPACCEYDFGLTRLGIQFQNASDPEFDPAFVADAYYNPPVGLGCEGFPYECRFAGDAPFVPGERYFIGRATIVAHCGPQPDCQPPGTFFDAYFYPYFEGPCDETIAHGALDCAQPPGACCLPEGGCIVVTEVECESLQGRYQGWDTACEATPCPPTGACCLDDASCHVLTGFACHDRSGTFSGDGTLCVPSPCPPGGACCFDDGTCLFLTESACGHDEGAWVEGASCDPAPCDVGGSCCLPDGRCARLTEAVCHLSGGSWSGPDVACEPYPCPPVRVEADGSGMVATIQDAIDAVTTGGIVELGSGVYRGEGNRDLAVAGKEVVIRSRAADPDSVVIDCERQARGIRFGAGAGAGSALEHVTIVNGSAGTAGGVVIDDASPTLRGCRILACTGTAGGAGGLSAWHGHPVLIDCAITGNLAGARGGGVAVGHGLDLIGCTIAGNRAGNAGGGVYLAEPEAQIRVERTVVWDNCNDQGPDDVFVMPGDLERIESSCSIIDAAAADTQYIFGEYSSDDPLLCTPPECQAEPTIAVGVSVASNSPCLPEASPCGERIGAGNEGCGPIETGACCLGDGTCSIRSAESCEQVGAGFVPGGTCDPDPCGLVACCLADASCELLPAPYCTANGGEALPGQESCDPSPCGIFYVHPDGSGQYPTIQAAVNAMDDGETLLLLDGVFSGVGNRYITPQGKAITIRSASGDAASCIIDCRIDSLNAGWAFSISQGEGAGLRIEQITIRNGSGTLGGGMRIIGASPTLVGCVFESCSGTRGGAIYLNESGSLIERCRFSGCSATEGGGIYSVQSSPTIASCVFDGNAAGLRGGAIVLSGNPGDETALDGNTLFGNSSATGSAIALESGAQLSVARSIVAFGRGGEPIHCGTGASLSVACSDVYGNEGGDWVGCLSGLDGLQDNFSLDPLFCLPEEGDLYLVDMESPCLPENSPCGLLVGALGPGCDGLSGTPETPHPRLLSLDRPRPNPAVESCALRFGLPRPATVEVAIVDVAGRIVAIPYRGVRGAGYHEVSWDGRNLRGEPVPNGVYQVLVQADGERQHAPIVMLR